MANVSGVRPVGPLIWILLAVGAASASGCGGSTDIEGKANAVADMILAKKDPREIGQTVLKKLSLTDRDKAAARAKQILVGKGMSPKEAENSVGDVLRGVNEAAFGDFDQTPSPSNK